MSAVLDWVRFRPAVPLNTVNGFVELPVFSHGGQVWKGASELATQFNYSASKNFVLHEIPEKPVDCNYVLAIRYRIDRTVYRYLLWNDDAARVQAPLYTGQVIKKNFVLEIWTIQGQPVVSQDTAVQIVLSILQVVSNFQVFPANYADAVGAEVTAAQAAANLIPPSIDVPFDLPVNPAVNNAGNPAYFLDGGGNPYTFPVGTYNIQYIQGGWKKNSAGFLIADYSGLPFGNLLLVSTSAAQQPFAPDAGPLDVTAVYATQAALEAAWANSVSTWTLTAPSKIWMYWQSAPPAYAWTPGSTNPTFRIAPAFLLPISLGQGSPWLDNPGPRTHAFIPQPQPGSGPTPPTPPPPTQPGLQDPGGDDIDDPTGSPIEVP